MKIVKLTYNYDWPIFRQTPNFSQIWGDYKFVIGDDIDECDFWVVYTDHLLKPEKVKCSPDKFIFVTGEGYFTSPKYGKKFLNQFSNVITVQREIKHKKVTYLQNGLPWFINKTFDDIISLSLPKKTKLLSVVCSNKTTTEGHRKRLNFVLKLKEYFKEDIDVFGRGFKEIQDKSSALDNYKYSIAIENDFCLDYVTEKFFDCLYSNTLPFYYGCPNLEDYISSETFIRIDIDNISESIKIIERSIKDLEYDRRQSVLLEEAKKSIRTHQFFPLIVDFIEKIKSTTRKENITLNPNINDEYISFKEYFKRILKKVKRKLKWV